MINSFNAKVAEDFSLNVAVFLQHLSQWSFQNLVHNKNIHDGYVWSYNTLDEFYEFFPYWTKRQVERVINTCVNAGLIVKSNYNIHKYDRTCWYALTPKAMNYYPELKTEKNLWKLYSSIKKDDDDPSDCTNNELTEEQNAFFHFTVWCQAFHQTVITIPTNIPTKDISKDISKTPSNSSTIKTGELNIEELKKDNPHEIPEQMLIDWVSVRKQKKAKITKTAWSKINKTMVQIMTELKIKPVSAFETMVTNCWQSLDVKYFKKDDSTNRKFSKPYGAGSLYDGDISWI